MTIYTMRNPTRAVSVRPYRPYDLMDEIEMLARDTWEGWEPGTYRYLPFDMYEEKDWLVLRMEVPGFRKEDLDISLDGQELTIKGERKEEEVSKDSVCYYGEREFGCFSRTVTLPYPVDASKIESCLEDGILELRLPKAEEWKTKHIQIKVGKTPKAIAPVSKK